MLKIDERILGRYVVLDLLREGGQACVAKVRDEVSGATVVIRVLSAMPGHSNYGCERARFERASRIRIGHPNVVDPIGFGEVEGACCMILPFIEGQTLGEYLDREAGTLDHDRATQIIRKTADGLAACHDAGVTHRDVKPENILIDQTEQPRIIDLGMCSVAGERTITQGNGFQGSVLWASPEQFFDPRARDFRIDQYALGGIYYLLLTGKRPTEGSRPEQVMHFTCSVTPASPHVLDSAIPKPISDACMQLLAKDINDRFSSMREFIQALDAARTSGPTAPTCLSCGERVTTPAHFCVRCGADMTVPAIGAVPTHCMACGAIAGGQAACPGCQRAFSPADHRIEFTRGSLSGRIFRIPMDLFVTGREILAPRDSHISRRHLRLACINGNVMIEDAGSANKTLVDGQLLAQALTLKPNCTIVIAGSTGIYRKK